MSLRVDKAIRLCMESDEIRKRANKEMLKRQEQINILINDMNRVEVEAFGKKVEKLGRLSDEEIGIIKKITQENVEALYKEFKRRDLLKKGG